MAETWRISLRNVCVVGDGKLSPRQSLAWCSSQTSRVWGAPRLRNLLHTTHRVRRGRLSSCVCSICLEGPACHGQARPGLPSSPPNWELWVPQALKGQIIIRRESEAWAPQRATKINRGGGIGTAFLPLYFCFGQAVQRQE